MPTETSGKETNTREAIFDALNPAQQEAVSYCDGPQLVIAGAGSGKTRVLTYKIAYLIQSGMKPWSILALTFTNKAANEMKQRIGNIVGQQAARYIYMGTFHSIFSRILRKEAEHIGFTPTFTIYDEQDSRSLLKSIIKERGLDDKIYKPATVHNRISRAKNQLITAERYAADGSAIAYDRECNMPEIANIFIAYQQRCRQANAMDFDDLLLNTFLLFRDKEDVRMKYAQHFSYVLVDEYQDTNYAQQCIVLQLTREKQRICVVGDDAQSIYAFRGANIDNILNFQTIYPQARLFKLEQNYRSTQFIVQAANSLIKKNQRQIPKEVYSRNDKGEKLTLKHAYSDKEEAAIVCKEIRRIRREEKGEYSDFAILYRTNAQSRSFEEEMRKQAIPYRIYGGMSFYQRKEIKDVLAYFRLVINPDDEEAFKRIINYPARGIGDTTLQRIAKAAQQEGTSFWDIISSADLLDVNKGTHTKIDSFRMMIEAFREKAATSDAYELGQEIIKTSGVSADIYSGTDADALSRQENLAELVNSLQDFVITRQEEGRESQTLLADYLQEVALLTDLDSDDQSQSRVTLMTVHAAKGLEFPTVFIVGLEENIFPSQLSLDNPRELEEERRLLYVAITRAERHCIMTCAQNRWRYGRMEFDTPSCFIRDIDPALIRVEDSNEPAQQLKGYGRSYNRDEYQSDRPYRGANEWGAGYPSRSPRVQNSRPVASQFMADPKPKITSPRRLEAAVDPFSERFKQQLQRSGGNMRRIADAVSNGGRTLTNPSATGLKEGSIIEHQRFGRGTVLRIEGTGENTKATVEFVNTGTKQLLLKFAKFTIIA